MTTTWNPSDKSTRITLTGSDLIATMNSAASGPECCRAVHGITSGQKKYFEFEVTTTGAGSGVGVGVANLTFSLATYLGDDTNGISYFNDGPLYSNDVTLVTMPTLAAGDRGCVAIDAANDRIWVRKNGGNWNNSATANPATNTEGVDISAIAAGTRYPCVSLEVLNDAVTGKFATASWSFSAPSGFSEINNSVSGSAAITLADVTLAAAATVALKGQAAVTLANLTLSAAATVALKGQALVTLGDVSLLAAAKLSLSGSLGVTLAPLTLSATGSNSAPISGAAAIALQGVTLSARGRFLWNPVAAPGETWSPASAAAELWTPVNPNSETWTPV